MENNIIVLLNDYKEFKFNSNVIESLRFASNRWGCTFCEITKLQESINEQVSLTAKLLWNRILIMENFINYDKVLCIDTDVIINSKSPNIFDELDNDNDLAVVLDGNPGRFENDWFKKSIVNTILNINIEVYNKNIPNFNFEEYSNKYFNGGVVLFNPKNINKNIQKFKNLILNNKEIQNLLFQGVNFVDQNLPNAWFTSSPDIKIKYIKNEWNWIAPDIEQDYEIFLGPMVPWIYHFCGTNLSKGRLNDYYRWI